MAEPSTRDLSALPDVEGLRQLLQSLAMLDVILCEDWESRCFYFDAHWTADQMLGSKGDGSGDEFFAVFGQAGCFLKGFAHQSPMSPHHFAPPRIAPGVLDEVPADFAHLLREPSLDIKNTTFCIWRKYDDERWQRGSVHFPPGPDPDGSEQCLRMLDGDPATYLAWAEEHYGDSPNERWQVHVDDVRRVYNHEPLSESLVARIQPDRRFRRLMADAEEIGYPLERQRKRIS